MYESESRDIKRNYLNIKNLFSLIIDNLLLLLTIVDILS